MTEYTNIDDFKKFINKKGITRKKVVKVYESILQYRGIDAISDNELKKINQAIIKRWSLSGLIYIKDLAWKGV